MLEAKFETLKKTFQQLSGIHSKCRSQQEVTFTMYLHSYIHKSIYISR